jgi:hypothetical protein
VTRRAPLRVQRLYGHCSDGRAGTCRNEHGERFPAVPEHVLLGQAGDGHYEPTLGRFLSEDPLGTTGGPQRYAYAGGSPVNKIDSYGLKEGDAANLARRKRIAAVADHYASISSELWLAKVAKGRFPAGSYKCNLFVCDVTDEAGAPAKLNRAWSCPTAAEFANSPIANWRILGDSEEECPGDIVAYAWGPPEGGFTNASGHSGVVGKSGRVSAHTDKPVDTNFPTVLGAKLKFRRYTGQ